MQQSARGFPGKSPLTHRCSPHQTLPLPTIPSLCLCWCQGILCNTILATAEFPPQTFLSHVDCRMRKWWDKRRWGGKKERAAMRLHKKEIAARSRREWERERERDVWESKKRPQRKWGPAIKLFAAWTATTMTVQNYTGKQLWLKGLSMVLLRIYSLESRVISRNPKMFAVFEVKQESKQWQQYEVEK